MKKEVDNKKINKIRKIHRNNNKIKFKIKYINLLVKEFIKNEKFENSLTQMQNKYQLFMINNNLK